jgi:hypothetical protein
MEARAYILERPEIRSLINWQGFDLAIGTTDGESYFINADYAASLSITASVSPPNVVQTTSHQQTHHTAKGATP